LRDALKAIAAQGGISLVFANSVVPLERRVSLRVTGVTVEEALPAALRGTDVEVKATASGQMMLVRREEQLDRGSEERSPGAVQAVLSGRVTDAATGAPVARATVSVDGGTRRAVTNEAGQYSVTDVSAGVHTVSVRRIGYAPVEKSVIVPASGVVTADVILTPVASQLDEVVTTVTGLQRRLEVGNAIGRIAADSVVGRAPITTLTDLLGARVPAMYVMSSAGVTGTSPRIRIRGLNSFTVSNDPLLVMDGVRMDNSTVAFAGFGLGGGRLNDINPEEVESIEVIKGPSAATLYGTDAANGVIVIRTKRGQAGRPQWTAYAEGGLVTQPARFRDNYYSWGHNTRTNAIQQCVLTQAAAGACVIDSLSSFNPLTAAETSPLGTGSRQQYGVQVSGGVSQFTYFAAAEYENETGFLQMPGIDVERVSAERGGVRIPRDQQRPNALQRTSLRLNVSAPVGNTADVSASVGIISSTTRIPSPAIIGNGLFGPGYRDARNGWSGYGPGEAFAVRNQEDLTRYTPSLSSTWRPVSWLSARVTVGLDDAGTFLDGLQRRGEGPFGSARNGRRVDMRTDVKQYTVDFGASALFAPRERLSSRSSVGVQYNRRLLSQTTASGTNLLPGASTAAGAAVVTGSEQTVETVVAGTYAEQTFGFDDRLFLTGALRIDGGSAFGRDFRTAIYPKASASWLALGHGAGLLTTLRLRAAFGASGVMPNATAAVPQMTLSPAIVDNTATTGAIVRTIGNPDLRPERQAEFEVGVDGDVLDGRLRFEATYYDRWSRDALVNRPLPAELGVTVRQENIGSVRNRGLEGLVAATIIKTAAVQWDTDLNGSMNRNRLERLSADLPFIGNVFVRNQVGYPLFSFFDLPIIGYDDANGNRIIESSEVRVGDARVFLGTPMPTRQIMLSSALTLFTGRLRVSTLFDHRGGNVLFNTYESAGCNAGIANCRAANDPTASYDRQAAAVARNNPAPFQTLAGYLEDASFTRWRELSLTYAMPQQAAAFTRTRRVGVTLAGRNLHLFTRYTGADPEVSTLLGATAQPEGAADGSSYPPSRYWLLRVDVGF
jgi:TonB-linked SusC/RagA family outer membrane protein